MKNALKIPIYWATFSFVLPDHCFKIYFINICRITNVELLFLSYRLATITGHMPHEVVGLSAYAYIHSDDTAVTLFAHHLSKFLFTHYVNK